MKNHPIFICKYVYTYMCVYVYKHISGQQKGCHVESTYMTAWLKEILEFCLRSCVSTVSVFGMVCRLKFNICLSGEKYPKLGDVGSTNSNLMTFWYSVWSCLVAECFLMLSSSLKMSGNVSLLLTRLKCSKIFLACSICFLLKRLVSYFSAGEEIFYSCF